MMKRNYLCAAWLLGLCAASIAFPRTASAERLAPYYLRCEYQVDPLGIDETAPRLSWLVRSRQRATGQAAYQILVASTSRLLADQRGDLWDSGKIDSADTTGVVYRGRPLMSDEICFWKVKVWDAAGDASRWSEAARWSMGLLRPSDWRATWIGYDQMRKDTVLPAPFDDAKWIWYAGDKFPDVPKGSCVFMNTLNVPANADIEKAELLVAAADEVYFHINGSDVQMPHGSPDNKARLIDVSSLVKAGSNSVRVSVETMARGPAGLIAKLTIVSYGRQTNTLLTDASWRSTNDGGADWKNRPVDPSAWPEVQVIGAAGCPPWGDLHYAKMSLPPPPYLRREFDVTKPVQRATLYATALGLVDLHLNGERVSDDLFTPGWTDYRKRIHYRAYDVTKQIRPGRNALGAILADGWFSGFVGWGQSRDHYGNQPRFLGQLMIHYADGSDAIIASGPEWKASSGPIQEADFLMGEKFDARLANQWDEPGFDDIHWSPVATGAVLKPLLQAHPGPPVKPFATLAPKSISEPVPGVYVVDLGQNFAGVARLKVQGEPGREIRLRFAERLNPEGTVYTVNLRGARATDSYICSGHGIETWEPRFTYHGFQYVEVTGLKDRPSQDTITGIAFSSATSNAGSFACSDPMLNRLARNTYWTQRANFMDVPTDCPQRDERLGWMGDAQVYVRTATLHEDVQAFFTKWLVDVADGQRADGQFPMIAPLLVAGDDGGPAWADAGVICPWTIYEVYGDKRVLEKQYDSMVRFIDFCKNRSTADLLPPEKFDCFGDWLNINDDTPKAIIYEAYFAYSTKLLARTAKVLGNIADAAKYNDLFEKIKAAFNRAYVGADGRIQGDTQSDYVLALSFELLDADQQKLAAQHLVDNIEKRGWHLSTGFIGTKSLMLTLSQIGRNDVAERLIHNDTFPSWGFSIKHGATSIWERWDGWTPDKGFQDPGMNSFAHYSFGAVYQWMVENLGGIRSDGPAYNHIVIAPQLDPALTFADTTFDSIHGPIETHWSRQGKGLRLKVSIPPNTTATVRLPGVTPLDLYEGKKLVGLARGVSFKGLEGGTSEFEVAGDYEFWTK
jgi:alpha-L-rhamnosidase